VDERQELEWIERCRRGEREAFEPLVKRHYETAVRIAYGVVRNQEDAVDVAQNAFLKAYKNLGRFAKGSRFSTWLYRIVMNEAIDWKRRAVRRESVSLEAQPEGVRERIEQHTLIQPESGPRQAAADQELLEKLELCMEDLSPEHQQVLVLREVQGMPYSEIAEICGIKVGTVMSRLHYARETLRAKLEEWL
jgi:RNA polymerase sigma-70 factor (ECF subfamily)